MADLLEAQGRTVTPPITEEQLAELERLEREATPGPWRVDACEVLGPLEEAHQDVIVFGDAEATAEDMAVIAAARNAMPQLIAEVRRLREENAMRAQRDEARELVRRYVEGDCLYEVQRLLSGVSLPAGELDACARAGCPTAASPASSPPPRSTG